MLIYIIYNDNVWLIIQIVIMIIFPDNFRVCSCIAGMWRHKIQTTNYNNIEIGLEKVRFFRTVSDSNELEPQDKLLSKGDDILHS